MPVCPFCRKSVEITSVWCNCGANISRFPSIPASGSEVREWLSRHVPDALETSADNEGSLVEQARQRLLENQDSDIVSSTKDTAEATKVHKLIASFLADCLDAGLAPTVDIGQLRRDRWKQWKRIPAEYRQHAPLKSFKVTPGYIFEVNVAKYKDEFCVALDGTLYKHQLNSVDPFTIGEILKSATVEKIAEGLIGSLVWLLEAKQHPTISVAVESVPQSLPVSDGSGGQKAGRFKLPFGHKNDDNVAGSSTDESAPSEDGAPPVVRAGPAEMEPVAVTAKSKGK